MTKNELRQYHRLGEEIEDLKQRIADLRSTSLKSPNLDGMPRPQGGSGDPIGATIARIESLEARLSADEADRYLIETVISSVRDVSKRMVLRHRYMDEMPWEQIAEAMNYSVQHIYRIHGAALNEIAQK